MPEAQRYKTILNPSGAEYKDRGSRFLAFAYPVRTLEEIKLQVKELKSLHPKAVHHCVAYRLGHDGSQYRASDDGEPSGSAGRPILGAIDSAGLTNILVVVVRYFGGTLLGVPGLIHAYGSVTSMALEKAIIQEHWVIRELRIECDYAGLGEVLHLLRKYEASILKQDLQLFCVIHASIPLHLLADCTGQLSELRGVQCQLI